VSLQFAMQNRRDRALTPEQVRFVRQIRASRSGRAWRTGSDTTPTMEALAEEYGVAPRVLRMAAAGQTYKWVR